MKHICKFELKGVGRYVILKEAFLKSSLHNWLGKALEFTLATHVNLEIDVIDLQNSGILESILE